MAASNEWLADVARSTLLLAYRSRTMKIIGHVSLRDANQHLSRYVTAVEQGQEFVITRRRRPVAKLVPSRHVEN
jgi:prevent-host-death family protein